MKLPAALTPLRHPLFRMIWLANLVAWVGFWMQNTGAGWLMTSLAPDAFTVSLVQAATILPVFLFALPAGALADTVDRRLFILCTQFWLLAMGAILALITYSGAIDAWWLLVLTFAIGTGGAINNPALGSVMSETVPRKDLVQAIALNGVGFNLTRAIGPAIAGAIVVFGGPAFAFSLNAVSYIALIVVMWRWHHRSRPSSLPREHLLAAMRAGLRFARHTPVMRASMLRSGAFFFAAAAPWAMLPLVVKQQLHMGAATYGGLLGVMGIGGVTAGLLMPQLRARFSRGTCVFAASLSASSGMAILAIAPHFLVAAIGMILFGLGWVTAASVTQGAAQMAAPAWVRSRALAIFQLAFNLALAAGTFFWGWVGTTVGLSEALLGAAGAGLILAVLARRFSIDREADLPPPTTVVEDAPPSPEAVDPELVPMVAESRNRVLETQAYRIDPADQAAFLAAMAAVRDVRGRAGAREWQIFEDVAHAEGWLEAWILENWTDHLREAMRLSDEDRAVLARALAFHRGPPMPPRRYLAFPPNKLPAA
jgi:MFS family permease